MQRLVCVLLLAASACADNGTGMGAASLTYLTPAIQASYAQSFKGADGNGTTVLGWKLELSHQGVGTGCKADSVMIDASIGIFTSQTPGSASVAELQTGDISIETTAPPIAPTNGAAANMGATGVSGLEGTVSITGVGKAADGKTIISFQGTITAGGSDGNGAPVLLSGMFDAPVCN